MARTLFVGLLLGSMIIPSWAKPQQFIDLTELSLEELMEIEIISASKKEERLFEAAAAVYVITGEDIRRSGVTSIPEALRMVPGMEVAHIDANKWAITSRGFNDLFANKLLVLIDGRSVYTPLFSGVFWEAQDVLLEDVERIEVIRGPGAALWGANAVNGIINILTKSARDTQGGFLVTGVGSEERGFGCFRYGGKVGEEVYYRVYAKYFNRDNFVHASGKEAADGWDVLRGGFRMDWDISDHNSLTLGGDIYDGDAGLTYRVIDSLEPPYERTFDFAVPIKGGDVLGRWEHTFSDVSDLALQLYYDRAEREDAVVEGYLHKFDVDFQHRFGSGECQEIVWGFGYRFMSDEISGDFLMSVHPERRDYDLLSAFAQDEITFVEDRLRLTLGSKFEHNDYTGFEIQPNVRLLWTPHDRHTAWGAISRAVRTPSRGEDDTRIVREVLPSGLISPDFPTAIVVLGSRDFESEELLAFETGYRVRPTDRFFLDVAAFYSLYDKLLTVEPGTPYREAFPPPEHVVVPLIADNKMEGETYGVELEGDCRVLDWWRLRAKYAYLQMQIHLYEGSSYTPGEDWEGISPHHQLSLRSSMDLPGRLELDLEGRYVDDLPDIDIQSYLSCDIRLGWNPIENLEATVVGQNLLNDHHPEFRAPHTPSLPTEVERGVYGAIRWRF